MHTRITSIENLIACDPGGRNIFALVAADQLRLAAQSLRLARRVGIVSGFYIPEASAGETDGPPGAKILGDALGQLGITVDYITDEWNAPLFRALGIEPIVDVTGYFDKANPTHLVAVERVGRGSDGRYRNLRGVDVTETTAPLDELFLEASRRGVTTIGIGDGGNEIGMGKVFAEAMAAIEHGASIATIIPTDYCIGAGVSNWGAYGLTGAISVLDGRDLLPTADVVLHDLERVVQCGAVDGITLRHEGTTDGQGPSAHVRILEQVRRQIAPSPIERGTPLLVGILGYGESGAAAARLVARHGHRIRVSDLKHVTIDPQLAVEAVESGGHTIEFLQGCDVVTSSPGVRSDSPILDELRRLGTYVMSSLELAYQVGVRAGLPAASSLIAVTGTIGKRTTVELLKRLFDPAGRSLVVGGNRGRPLSDLLADGSVGDSVAIAVSSFQLETVTHFRPHIAVFLNVDEAHLDRHRSIAEYVRIKSRIFMNQRGDDVLILPFDDPRLRALAKKHGGRTLFVSTRQAMDRGAWLEGGRLWLNVDGEVESVGSIRPAHPENVLSAVLVARLSGLSSSAISEALKSEPKPGAST